MSTATAQLTMAPETAQRFEALEAQAQRLTAVFTRAGYELVAPAIIQPAGPFLDVIGESLRARTYVFTDPEGEELCLRPDLTVPTCRLHLARHPGANTRARYAYNGPAFRFQPGGDTSAHPREFRQAGIEAFADPDREEADASVLALIIAALSEAGLRQFKLRIGDLGLFSTLLDTFDMPDRWRRRLRHQFWRPSAFRAELQRLSSGAAGQQQRLPRELIARLDPHDLSTAQLIVADHLEKTNLEIFGSRTLAEVTERLLAEAADARAKPLPVATSALIEGYTRIKAPARDAAREVERLLQIQHVDLSRGLAAFQRRLDLLENAGVDTSEAEFSAEFGRNLEYYTGFVFEIVAPSLGPKSPIAGGGRYDSLLADLGAPPQVPAVGSSIHTERLLAVLQGTAT